MIRSMTGFGQAELTAAGYRIRVELKSVNHRYSEVAVRIPREWIMLEDAVKRMILQTVRRGRIDAFVTVERETAAGAAAAVDWRLAEAYASAAEQLRERFRLADSLSLKDLLAVPGLIRLQEEPPEASAGQLEQSLASGVQTALQHLVEMREREGRNLLADLQDKTRLVRELTRSIAAVAPAAAAEYRDRLRERLKVMLQTLPEDDARIEMEAAVYAERVSIDEELTRLDSHLDQFGLLLQAGEPVGRKIDFLIQEMNREVNTIGSKASSAAISRLVVELKAELEKIREQVQNVE